MGYSEERQAIEAKFIASWATATPISHLNAEYNPVAGTTYVEIEVRPLNADQISLGDSPLHRHPGFINIAIKGPIGEGTGVLLALADRAMAIFRDQPVFSNILCRSPYPEIAGELDGWFQVNVIVPFQRDENF